MPAQLTTSAPMEEIAAFLKRHGPSGGEAGAREQGQGVSVGVASLDELDAAIAEARKYCSEVLVEERVEGEDVRSSLSIIAWSPLPSAARPRWSRRALHGARADRGASRRRAAATSGESRIPCDGETERTVRDAGFSMADVLPAGTELKVRRTANLHTGRAHHP